MSESSALADSLKRAAADLERVWQRLDLEKRCRRREECQQLLARPDVWRRQAQQARQASQELAGLDKSAGPWLRLKEELDNLRGLLAEEPSNKQASAELVSLLEAWQRQFAELKDGAACDGPYDNYEVILSIFAGAGGTDAQDWAQMLLRMYDRWAERAGLKREVISYSGGEEAGIKSVSLYLRGQDCLYGRLKGEHGVHRLVRISPFNAQNLRQTSFAKVEVMPALEEPDEIVLKESELRFDVFRSSGHGGQSVNTTDSAVRVTHLPTKLTVVIQNERSQLQNRRLALMVLRSRLARLQAEEHAQALEEIKGQPAANEWGSQIRNYVLHPYKQVKDLRSQYTTTEINKVLDGELDGLLKAQQSLAGD